MESDEKMTYHAKSSNKRVGVSVLIPNQIYIKMRNITRDRAKW